MIVERVNSLTPKILKVKFTVAFSLERIQFQNIWVHHLIKAKIGEGRVIASTSDATFDGFLQDFQFRF